MAGFHGCNEGGDTQRKSIGGQVQEGGKVEAWGKLVGKKRNKKEKFEKRKYVAQKKLSVKKYIQFSKIKFKKSAFNL